MEHQAETPLKATPTQRNLATHLARDWSDKLAPTGPETIRMLDDFLRLQRWSRSYFCALMGFRPGLLHSLEHGQRIPKIVRRLIARMVWTYWMLHVCPGAVFNPAKLASWARTEHMHAVGAGRLTTEAFRAAVMELESERDQPPAQRLRRSDIARRFQCSITQAAALCRAANYQPTGGSHHRRKKIETLLTESAKSAKSDSHDTTECEIHDPVARPQCAGPAAPGEKTNPGAVLPVQHCASPGGALPPGPTPETTET